MQAIVGGAIIPLAEGALADRIGIHHAFILPALCYIYIAYYGYRGSVHKDSACSPTRNLTSHSVAAKILPYGLNGRPKRPLR